MKRPTNLRRSAEQNEQALGARRERGRCFVVLVPRATGGMSGQSFADRADAEAVHGMNGGAVLLTFRDGEFLANESTPGVSQAVIDGALRRENMRRGDRAKLSEQRERARAAREAARVRQ